MSQDAKPAPPDALLRFFRHAHLPPQLARVSRPFAEMAAKIVLLCPPGAERTTALRRLLESKDCAVRAVVPESAEFLEEWAAVLKVAEFEIAAGDLGSSRSAS